MDLNLIQKSLARHHFDAWLLTDFQGNNPPARDLLSIPDNIIATRRWFYLLPVEGIPIRIVNAIEPAILDHLPGDIVPYRGRLHMIDAIKSHLKQYQKVAMEYSPNAQLPYVSRVDAGLIELIRNFGCVIESSADLLQELTAVWSDSAIQSHQAAAEILRTIVDEVFLFIKQKYRSNILSEFLIQQFITKKFRENGLVWDHDPIAAIGVNSANPHYEVNPEKSAILSANNLILIDLWAKLPDSDAVYADISWTAFTGASIPDTIQIVFSTVKAARDRASEYIMSAFSENHAISGADVDAACRRVIEKAQFGQYFVHRTGHSLGRQVHGPGANLDSYESFDHRKLLPRTGFTVEPGIYLPGQFGVRSEYNVLIHEDKKVEITGLPVQSEIFKIKD